MASKRKKTERKLIGFKYLGAGRYWIQGLPARDVSIEEVESQKKRWGGVEAFAKYEKLYKAVYAPEEKAPPKPEDEAVPESPVETPEQPVEDVIPENEKE